jgi:hypothetical protein
VSPGYHEREAVVLAGQPHEAPYPACCEKQTAFTNRIGWYTFRHSFGTLLKANGEDVKTVQDSYGRRTAE